MLADDNFYPVTFDDLAQARRRTDTSRLRELEALREERFELMARLAELPDDLVFYTQITMEAAEDPEFLDAMKRARILGALVGVESVTRDGLKDVYKGFNLSGDDLVARLREFRRHGVYILGSFIFGLPSDAKDTFDTTVALAEQADLTFAQFVLLTPFPGTVDFEKWAAEENRRGTNVDGVPVTQHWLIPEDRRPKVYTPHPTMSLEDIRVGTQRAWDRFYSWPRVWARSRVVQSMRARLAFVLVSKMYRQMYANTGMATDSARMQRSARWARWLGTICQRHFWDGRCPTWLFQASARSRPSAGADAVSSASMGRVIEHGSKARRQHVRRARLQANRGAAFAPGAIARRGPDLGGDGDDRHVARPGSRLNL